ncbi:hypothetical protein [Campylobacter jejuni]|uniref:hypothetical protein n=1 Tax=Campylobacter jejuni TaxID=197 RepID=UPI00111D29B2|nr:hypothetical protein [Campylobacter jejuni]
MINRIFMKENLGFKKAELEISKGLTVFTGLSGAGKSVLFKGILSAFSLSESEAKIVEIELDDKLDLESFGIESEEENVFKLLKEKNTKYFINNQSIAKKSLQNLSKTFIKYLSAKENNEFGNEKFLNLLDALEMQENTNFISFLEDFKKDFNAYSQIYRNSKIYFVKPSFVLEPNDSILIVGDPVVLQSIFHNIRGKAGQFPMPFGSNVFALIDMKNMNQNMQERVLDTTLKLTQKSNAKRFFIHVVNPKLGVMYEKLKKLSEDKEGVFFDYFNTDFKQISTWLQNNDIGLVVTDIKNFEKEKQAFFDLKIPIMKVGEASFDELKEAIILSADESELENNANVITDLSKQLDFGVILYYYNPNSQNTTDMEEYFRSLSKLYDKNIQIINKNDENPLLNLQYREDLLQFVSFQKELLNRDFGRNLSTNLNRHYYKMRQNYQLFIPVE